MSIFNLLPESLATTIFLPLGIYFGYITHYYNININTILLLDSIHIWPYIIGCSAALFTGIAQVGLKFRAKRVVFEHFYVMMFGLFFLFASGILILMQELIPGHIMGAIGHGICYIPALSYINIRLNKSNYRNIKQSIPHLVYLIGVAVGSTVTFKTIDTSVLVGDTADAAFVIGVLLLITVSFIYGFYIVLEVLQYFKVINYKRSLDEDINRENLNKGLFKHKFFYITPEGRRHFGMTNHQIQLRPKLNETKENIIMIHSILSTVKTVLYFYHPFIIISYLVSVKALDFNLFIISWFGVAGMALSIVTLTFVSYKTNYLLSCAIKIVYLGLILILFAADLTATGLKIVKWMFYLVLGFGYSKPDINILHYTSIKHNEIHLATAYVIQYMVIGALQYVTIFHQSSMLDSQSNFHLVFAHSLAFAIAILLIGIVAVYVLPKDDHRSLLEIKNTLNNCNHQDIINDANRTVEMQALRDSETLYGR